VDYEELRVDDEDHVRLITLNRPERRNAMSWRMLAEVANAMAAADEDDDVRVVVPATRPRVGNASRTRFANR
jgi:enoyl-CoA hydratase